MNALRKTLTLLVTIGGPAAYLVLETAGRGLP